MVPVRDSPADLISIHALREEGDGAVVRSIETLDEFLSTPSVRRATQRPDFCNQGRRHFYPRPP